MLDGTELDNGDACVVVAGTHEGARGTVQDKRVSATGAITVTVVQANGERFKTLAKNLRAA
jgi:ribosomal protein S4E